MKKIKIIAIILGICGLTTVIFLTFGTYITFKGMDRTFARMDNEEELDNRFEAYSAGKITAQEMLAFCDQELTKAGPGKGEYAEAIYATRTWVFLIEDDPTQALLEARKAVDHELSPDTGRRALAGALASMGKFPEAADALYKVWDESKYLVDYVALKEDIEAYQRAFNPILVEKLAAAFTADKTAALKKYKGPYFTIRGKISSVNQESPQETFLEFTDPATKRKIICFFSKGIMPQVVELREGQIVTVSGFSADMSQDPIILGSCWLLAVEQ